MTAALTPTLINKDFQNWLKGALAVLFAKEGLIDLIEHENIDFQNHLLQTVYTQKGIPPGTTCSSCTTANVLPCPTAGFCSKGKKCKAHDSKVPDKKPNQPCPNALCLHIRDAIKNGHRFKGPSWKNTDARRWCSDEYEVSKCFMPPDGYSDKTCLEDTDFNGILAVVINNNRFQRKMSVNLGLEPNICTEARIIGREIRHSANHLLSDQDLKKYIDDLITLLSDSAYLATDVKANDAVGKLKQLKTNTLTIHDDDITNALNESIKTTLDDHQQVILRNIQEHFKILKKDSVEAIDRKVHESVDKLLDELKSQTEKGKNKLNAETEKGKIELNLQSKTDKDELHRYYKQGADVLNAYTKKGKDELQTQLEQGKDVLNTYTNKSKDELKTQLEQGTNVLNTYTRQGKDELQTQLEQGTNVLNTYTRKGKDELQTQLEQGTNVLNTYTRKGKDELQTQLEQGTNVLNTYTRQGKDELQTQLEQGTNVLNTYTRQGKDELQTQLEQGTNVLNTYTRQGKDELQTQLEQGTNVLNTYTRKGKDELQTQLEQGTNVLNTYTRKGKDELQTQLEQGTNVLNTYTRQGKDELQTQLEQGTNVLNTYTRQGKDELQTQLEQGTNVLNTYTRKGKDELQAQIEQGTDVLGDSIVLYTRTINNVKHKGIQELQEVTKTGKQELEVQSKFASEKINRSADCATTKKTEYGFWDKITFKELRLRSEFKQELVRFYSEKESMIPASPLVEDHAVPLTELYVQPPMSAFIKPNAFGQGNKHSEKTPVRSYRELFINNDNVPYKNIYLEANAGYGKTSFTQKLAMTWCQAHRPNKLTKCNFKQDDVYTIKRFEFLFLLHLRDFQGDTCNLDELILQFVSRNLPNKEQYSEQFIAKILKNKTCLVIIDGLDEWVHPETCKRAPAIPHNNYRGSCTVLTTTRPWKLSTIGLPPNLIDRHLEISPLDDTTSNQLKSNAVKLLSENSGEREPDLNDFDRKVSSVKLGDIRLIPYILLQLICIWFDGLSIGKSKCETYSNTIELTLHRGLNKKNAPTLPNGNVERNATVPECMRHNPLCNQYMNLLLKLGKVSFFALFQKIKESSLVIDGITVLKFLTEKELEFCLKIGLLSQSKEGSLVSVKRYQVFFQHKSIQEFMAALYITSEWNKGTIKSTILEVCSSISSILEMENLFVFVCGMNPEVYTCISGELQTIVKHNRITDRHQTHIYRDEIGTMLAYQSMQVQCFQESVRNGNDNCSIPLQDFVIRNKTLTEDDNTALVKIIDCTIVHTSSGDKTIGLQSLDLYNVTMTHSNIERLYAYISQTTTLTQLKLEWIRCLDHEGQYHRDCDVTLDLHRLNELKMLHLVLVPCRELHVNPACLEKLEFSPWEKMTARASATLWQDLRAAPVLSSLTLRDMTSCQEMIQTIPTLTQLQYLQLVRIDMGDVIPRVSPEMTHLEHVELWKVTMSSAAWQELFFSIGQLPRSITVKLSHITMTSQEWRELLLSVGGLQHPVTVELFYCEGPSEEEWRTIVNVIKTTPTLSLLQDLSIDMWGASLTLKNKTV